MNSLRNEKIDRLERKLLKANRVSRKELQEIVSAPQFFDRVNARIKAGQAGKRSEEASGKRAFLPVWSWQKIGLALGGLAVFLTGALSLIIFTKQAPTLSSSVEQAVFPEIQRQTRSAENPEPQPPALANNTSIKIKTWENPVGKTQHTAERTAFKNKTVKPTDRASRRNSTRKSPPVENETEEVFYPLAFAENLEEAKKDGQIIRVDLSRSSLLALGLNPPMDDETVKIKTDLLIGSDGVAQGIRFVK